MTIETLKSPNPRNRNGISVIKLKFLSVSSMNTLLAILKVTAARRDVMLAGGLYHRCPWRHLPPPAFALPSLVLNKRKRQASDLRQLDVYLFALLSSGFAHIFRQIVIRLETLSCTNLFALIRHREKARKFDEGERERKYLFPIFPRAYILCAPVVNRDLKIRRRRVSTTAAVSWGEWGEVAVVWREKLTLRSTVEEADGFITSFRGLSVF